MEKEKFDADVGVFETSLTKVFSDIDDAMVSFFEDTLRLPQAAKLCSGLYVANHLESLAAMIRTVVTAGATEEQVKKVDMVCKLQVIKTMNESKEATK